jgi:cytoskeletal protein RodZ
MSNRVKPKIAPPPKRRSQKLTLILSGVVILLGLLGTGTAFGIVGHGSKPQPPKSLSQAVAEQSKQQQANNGTLQQAGGVSMTTPAAIPHSTETPVSVGAHTGGCTPGYGQGALCLQITPPSAVAMDMTVQEMPWTCTEVKTIFPNGLPLNVKGVDPAHLDGNKDGIACDTGDAG